MKKNKDKIPVITNKMVTREIKFAHIIPQTNRKRKIFFSILFSCISLVVIFIVVLILVVVL